MRQHGKAAIEQELYLKKTSLPGDFGPILASTELARVSVTE